MIRRITTAILVLALLFFTVFFRGATNAAPTTVSITSPNGTTVTGSSLTVTGTATANSTISVQVNGVAVGSTTSNGSGAWSLEVTNQAAGAKTVQATASTEYAYVINSGGSSISVINVLSNQVVNTITTDVPLGLAAVRPDGTQLAVTQFDGVGVGTQVRIYSLADPTTPTLSHSITTPAGGTSPSNTTLAYSPDGTKLLIPNTDTADGTPSYVSIYPTTTYASPNNLNAAANSCAFPAGISGRAGTNLVYVNCVIASTVTSINATTEAFTGTSIDLTGQGGSFIAGNLTVSKDGNTAFQSYTSGGYLYPINLTTNTVGTRTAINGVTAGTPNNANTKVSATSQSATSVGILNIASNTITNTINTGGGSVPYHSNWSNDDSKLLVANRAGDSVLVYDGSSYALLATVAVGDAPTNVVVASAVTSSATSTFTLAAASLADTGQNSAVVYGGAFVLVVTGAGILLYRRRLA